MMLGSGKVFGYGKTWEPNSAPVLDALGEPLGEVRSDE